MLKLFFQAITIYFTLVLTCYFHRLHVCFFYLTDSLSEIYSDISCTSLGVNSTFCMQFTGEVTSVVVENNMIGLY